MASAKPSFLQAYQPPAEEDVLPRPSSSSPGSSSSGSADQGGSRSRGSSVSSTKRSQKPSSRRKKQWDSSSGVDGLVFYTLGLAAALGTGAYFAWKRWQQHQKAKSQRARAAASSSGQDNATSSRSPFTFDKPSRNKKNDHSKRGQATSAAVIKQPPIPVANLQQQPLRAGNPKKDKELRKERKAMKEARKQAVRDQQEQVHVAAARAAEAVGQTQEDPTRVTYIDYDKTADAFQRVKDWQETGKKKFN